jgi:aminopeptidase
MDPRVRDHAETLVEHSTAVEAGDEVLVRAPPAASDLVVALYRELGERGARPVTMGAPEGAGRAYKRAMDADDFALPDHQRAAMEAADVIVGVWANHNVNEGSDVDPETNAAHRKAHEPLQEIQLEKRWVATQHPAPGDAQKAEMSTETYADFVYEAVNRDWEEQRAFQAQMVELLDPAEQVRIVSGEDTDVTMSVAGNPTQNDHAEHNLPGGEVFTAPVPDSVEGEVHFDMPLVAQGREVEGVRLRFEEGEVVAHEAQKNEAVLDAVLDTDEGARRLGELGIGMNRAIDQFTYNMLFDEKMGDTVHMALGRAYDDTVGEDNEANQSAMHMDMIVDMSEDSRIEVDGEVVQRDGTFVFEDDFE